LKNELVHHRRFATREQAKQEITEYIEIFYNRQRKQARLGQQFSIQNLTVAKRRGRSWRHESCRRIEAATAVYFGILK